MKFRFVFPFIALLTFGVQNVLAANPASSTNTKLNTKEEKLSYSIGINVGKNVKNEKFKIDYKLFIEGIKDSLEDKSLLSEKEIEEIITNFQKEEIAKRQNQYKKLAETNLIEGKKFLKANQAKKDIKTLPSGLQYKITKKGKGLNPTLEDIVTVNYIGTLIDGKEFDNSYLRKTPTSFKLKDVIKGWQEGLQLINPGSKITLYIPSDLAYGETQPSPYIGPNSVLIFDVELVKIEKPMH